MGDSGTFSSPVADMTATPSATTMAATTSDLMDDSGSTGAEESTVTMAISPTSSSRPSTSQLETNTDTTSSVVLRDSFTDPGMDLTQFPMQHATDQLPGSHVAMTTTEKDTLTTDQFVSTVMLYSTVGVEKNSGGSESISAPVGVSRSSEFLEEASSELDIKLTTTVSMPQSGDSIDKAVKTDSSVSSSVSVQSTHSDFLVIDPLSGTKSSSVSVKGIIQTTSLSGSSDVQAHSSAIGLVPQVSRPQPSATSQELYSTYTPAQTLYTSGNTGLDTSFMQTSSPSLPPPTHKPVQTSSEGQSTILGHGLPDYILYAGVPAIGVGLFIFLLICIICICRRKHKASKSSDMWVNHAQADITLTTRKPGSSLEDGIPFKPNIAKHSDNMLLRKRKGQSGIAQKPLLEVKPPRVPDHVDIKTSPASARDSPGGEGRQVVVSRSQPVTSVGPRSRAGRGQGSGRHGGGQVRDQRENSILNERLIELHTRSEDEGTPITQYTNTLVNITGVLDSDLHNIL
ncbi:hypothetical protein MAR_025289 [Mya arenaria]|uniref:Uncharacterized protein n=1 Tax=Mya arenaria TaxID=6604 RepID=A0ABY7DVM5_MYAAR|nr:hypothetical protein MAR_025289 [Mya arenaria]